MKRVIRISGKAKDVFGALAKVARENPHLTIGEIAEGRLN